MKLGISEILPHTSPEEWAGKHAALGLEAVIFPCACTAETAVIDAYVRAAKAAGLVIAEVGAWSNPLSPDEEVRRRSIENCKRQLELAEYVGACCCVNIAGAKGPVWDGGYADNYSQRTYDQLVRTLQDIIDAVRPQRTVYSLEPMPNMLPDSPEEYLRLLQDVHRPGFGVHMDAVNMISSPRIYFQTGAFVAHCFDLLGDKVASCHLKDCILQNRLTVAIEETECGKGGFDIPAYIQAAERCNPQMPMIIEHLSSWEQFANAIHYIQGLCRDSMS